MNPRAMHPYRRILVLLELDRHDNAVLRRAFALCSADAGEGCAARLRLLHAADAGRGLGPDQYPLPEPGAAERALMEHVHGRVTGRLAALGLPPLVTPGLPPVATEVRFGNPAKAARGLAREWGADLIVTSRPARYDLNRAWSLAALTGAAFASATPSADPARPRAWDALTVRAPALPPGLWLRELLRPLMA